MLKPDYQPIVEVTRGPITESIHFGALAITDSAGNLLASIGSPETVVFTRSSAKPFQALPFVESGGVETFGFDDQELAIMCASHSGTSEHVAVIRGMQKKIGISEKDLLCGTHLPLDKPTARQMELHGETLSPLQHNCSGKHIGMIAHAMLRKLPIQDYINPQHPVQQAILSAFAEMCSLETRQVVCGTDGCSVPTFAVPLRSSALAYARLADPVNFGQARAAALNHIRSAMIHHARMVAGPGRIDTDLMQAANGTLVAKIGAEGYHAIGVLPGALRRGSPALGITFKIADGDIGERARTIVTIEVLRQIGALTETQVNHLAAYHSRPIHNQRRLQVGEIRPCFDLKLKR